MSRLVSDHFGTLHFWYQTWPTTTV